MFGAYLECPQSTETPNAHAVPSPERAITDVHVRRVDCYKVVACTDCAVVDPRVVPMHINTILQLWEA